MTWPIGAVYRVLVVVTSALLTARCAMAQPAVRPAAQPPSAKATQPAIAALMADFPAAQVRTSGESDPLRITGLTPAATITAPTPEDAARAVLRIPSLTRILGLSPDLRELCHAVTRGDGVRQTHAIVRMQQCVGGASVLGAELLMDVRFQPTASIEHLTSSLSPGLSGSSRPTLSAADAELRAQKAFDELASDPRMKGRIRSTAEPSRSELTFFDPLRFHLEGPARLCWQVRVHGIVFLIDAHDGGVVYKYEGAAK